VLLAGAPPLTRLGRLPRVATLTRAVHRALRYETAVSTGLQIRPARPDEVAALGALAYRSKKHWGYDEAFMEACRDELTLTVDDLSSLTVYVLEHGETLLGFYALERLRPEQQELHMLFVEPSHIRQGHGRTLLAHAKQQATTAGATSLVIQSDPHAMPFYESLGARKLGTRPSASIPGRLLPVLLLQLALPSPD
jgi:GNAT superfamily N-acetyltransferase